MSLGPRTMAADQRHRSARQQRRQHLPLALLAVAAAAALPGSVVAQQPKSLDITDSFQDFNVVPAVRASVMEQASKDAKAVTNPLSSLLCCEFTCQKGLAMRMCSVAVPYALILKPLCPET